MPPKDKVKSIKNKKITKERRFSGKKYITDYKSYDSKIKARSIIFFLKTKSVHVRARVIDKESFFIIYYGKNTYNEIKYGKLKVPSFESIPIEIVEMVNKQENIKHTKIKKGKAKNLESHKVIEIQSNYTAAGKERKEKYEVLKLDKEISTTDLLIKTTKKKPKEELESEEEAGIKATLDYVEDEFFRSCPKCGDQMKPSFIVMGPLGRMSVYQCGLCKFYLPRNLSE